MSTMVVREVEVEGYDWCLEWADGSSFPESADRIFGHIPGAKLFLVFPAEVDNVEIR